MPKSKKLAPKKIHIEPDDLQLLIPSFLASALERFMESSNGNRKMEQAFNAFADYADAQEDFWLLDLPTPPFKKIARRWKIMQKKKKRLDEAFDWLKKELGNLW